MTMFKTVYDVSICALVDSREVEVTFVRPPLPGYGLTGVLWDINRTYPSITVEHWEDSIGYTGIFNAETDGQTIRTTGQETPLDAISYRLYIPYNFDIREVVHFLESWYKDKQLSVIVVFDSKDGGDGSRSSKQPVPV